MRGRTAIDGLSGKGGSASGAADAAPVSVVRAVDHCQTRIGRDLTRLGYNPGPVDGVMGPKTRAAIARFENDQRRKEGTRTVAPATDAEKMASTTN